MRPPHPSQDPEQDERLAVRIRDAVSDVARGNTSRYVPLNDIGKLLGVTDTEATQRAAIVAGALGWIKVAGRDVVNSVAITPAGRSLARRTGAERDFGKPVR